MSKNTIKQASFGRQENVMEKVVEKSCMEFEELKRVRTVIQAHWQHHVAWSSSVLTIKITQNQPQACQQLNKKC